MIFNIMSTVYLKIDCSCGRPFEFALFVSDVDFLQRRPVLPVQSQDLPQVWIARVYVLPDAVSEEVDGDVTLVNMQCEYFTTQVLKAKGDLKHGVPLGPDIAPAGTVFHVSRGRTVAPCVVGFARPICGAFCVKKLFFERASGGCAGARSTVVWRLHFSTASL